MRKYRIFESEERFLVQKRFLFFFWRFAIEDLGSNYFRPVFFHSLAEAEDWIANREAKPVYCKWKAKRGL